VIRRVLRFFGLVAPRPEDFDAMSGREFDGYLERSGIAARIEVARSEPLPDPVIERLMGRTIEEHICDCDGAPWCVPHLGRFVRGDEIYQCAEHDHVDPIIHDNMPLVPPPAAPGLPAELRALSEAATPGPWIRKWGVLTVHAMSGDGVFERQENIDFAVAAVTYVRALAKTPGDPS
jgi:hypothetical protein